MIMTRREIALYFILIILLFPTYVSGAGFEKHMATYALFFDVNPEVGGLKGADLEHILRVHCIIDGTQGHGHRHDGSHDRATVVRIAKRQGIPGWVAANVHRLHIYQDMIWSCTEGGKDGVNGHRGNKNLADDARKNLKEMKSGKKPKDLDWEKKPGPNYKTKSDAEIEKSGKKLFDKHKKHISLTGTKQQIPKSGIARSKTGQKIKSGVATIGKTDDIVRSGRTVLSKGVKWVGRGFGRAFVLLGRITIWINIAVVAIVFGIMFWLIYQSSVSVVSSLLVSLLTTGFILLVGNLSLFLFDFGSSVNVFVGLFIGGIVGGIIAKVLDKCFTIVSEVTVYTIIILCGAIVGGYLANTDSMKNVARDDSEMSKVVAAVNVSNSVDLINSDREEEVLSKFGMDQEFHDDNFELSEPRVDQSTLDDNYQMSDKRSTQMSRESIVIAIVSLIVIAIAVTLLLYGIYIRKKIKELRSSIKYCNSDSKKIKWKIRRKEAAIRDVEREIGKRRFFKLFKEWDKEHLKSDVKSLELAFESNTDYKKSLEEELAEYKNRVRNSRWFARLSGLKSEESHSQNIVDPKNETVC